jgi:hypothetical protein
MGGAAAGWANRSHRSKKALQVSLTPSSRWGNQGIQNPDMIQLIGKSQKNPLIAMEL